MRALQAARGGALADRDRAQPRRDPRRRLDRRSRPRGRRGRRRPWPPGTPDDVRRTPPRIRAGARLRAGAVAGHRVEEAMPLQSMPQAPARGRGGYPHRQRARAQPEGARRRHPARQVQRRHRRQRLRQDTLAFDIPVQRRPAALSRSLNAYARSIVQPAGRPEVDAVYGIPPTVAIEQRLSRGGRKSTVATTTEVWHFLRLLFVKLGLQHCTVRDGTPVRPQSAGEHRRATAARPCGRARGTARAARRQPGRLYRPRDWARRAAHASAWTASSCPSIRGRGSIASGTHARAAGGRHRRQRRQRGGAARELLAKTLELGRA